MRVRIRSERVDDASGVGDAVPCRRIQFDPCVVAGDGDDLVDGEGCCSDGDLRAHDPDSTPRSNRATAVHAIMCL